jgi:hypothetical protein
MMRKLFILRRRAGHPLSLPALRGKQTARSRPRADAWRKWRPGSSRARQELGVRFRSARECWAPTLDWLKQEHYTT